MTKKTLVVEGITDKFFFEYLCKKNNFDVNISVETPSNILNSGYNTKQGVFNILQILIKQLADSSIERIGIIIDCDYIKDGGGVTNVINQIHSKIKDYGYSSPYKTFTNNTGIYFEGENDLPKLGVWIMPNNKDEGMLENWLLDLPSLQEQQFLQYVKQIISEIPNPKFSKIHEAKAITNTWLAWQTKPTQDFSSLFKSNLIDEQHKNYTYWLDWMREIFVKP